MKIKYPPTLGSWKILLKQITIRQIIFGIPSILLVSSLFLAPIGVPMFLAVWVWTVEYIFRTKKEFPPEKQYLNLMFGILAIFPVTYLLLFFLVALLPFVLIFYFIPLLLSYFSERKCYDNFRKTQRKIQNIPHKTRFLS